MTAQRPEPPPVEQDSRGILDPWLLRRSVTLTRYPAGEELDGLIDRFWAVRWDLPDGAAHQQHVLTHPTANLTVGNANLPDADPDNLIEARCNGVARSLTTRTLAGTGWTVAAMTTPGGLGAFIDGPAAAVTDRVVPLQEAMGGDDAALIDAITCEPAEAERVELLAEALRRAIRPSRVMVAKEVAAVARLAETDRTIRTLEDLAARAAVTPRTLQRMFKDHAGVSPTWVLRRYRLIDAAESVANGQPVSWANLADTLGYADQAHLIRDFRAATGSTPAAYAHSRTTATGFATPGP